MVTATRIWMEMECLKSVSNLSLQEALTRVEEWGYGAMDADLGKRSGDGCSRGCIERGGR
jgi:hypothetical protein